MFQLTSGAAFAINEARRQSQVPENFGIRLWGRKGPSGIGVRISFVEAPAASDTVAEQHGTQIFISEELAAPLADSTLDVQPAVSENGATPANRLVLLPQGSDD